MILCGCFIHQEYPGVWHLSDILGLPHFLTNFSTSFSGMCDYIKVFLIQNDLLMNHSMNWFAYKLDITMACYQV